VLNPRALATLGIGYGPRAIATLGLLAAVQQPPAPSTQAGYGGGAIRPRHAAPLPRQSQRRRRQDEDILLLLS
jgi:hypothetical protein